LNILGILFLGVGLPLTEMTEDFINSKTTMRLDEPSGPAVTTPFPLSWMPDCLGPDRIQDDIAADLQKVGILLNENRFKPALKHIAYSAEVGHRFRRKPAGDSGVKRPGESERSDAGVFLIA